MAYSHHREMLYCKSNGHPTWSNVSEMTSQFCHSGLDKPAPYLIRGNPVFSLWVRFHPRGGSTPEGGPFGPEAIWIPAFEKWRSDTSRGDAWWMSFFVCCFLPGAFRLLLPVSCLLPISSVWLTDYWSLMTDHSFFTAYCFLPSAYFSLPFPRLDPSENCYKIKFLV